MDQELFINDNILGFLHDRNSCMQSAAELLVWLKFSIAAIHSFTSLKKCINMINFFVK